MNIFTSSELASKTKAVCDTARSQGCAVITTNGKADLAMIDLSRFETINDFVHEYDRWRAETSLRNIWAKTDGTDISEEDIAAEISAARAERKRRTAKK